MYCIDPALFEAWQVYSPLCLYPTELKIRMLVLVPIIVVVRDGSEETTSPFRLHVIFSGSSPLLMEHVTWAYSPSLTTLLPKLKGTISGGSKIKGKKSCLGYYKMLLITSACNGFTLS